MNKILCVISHTHWDREWYKSFEEFRLKLVDLIDRLLKIIEKDPRYIFHLDAQTIVLEDYLEIRPSKRPVLEKYIKSKNIIVGPWYLQNDFYLVSAEAVIRNLIIGNETATAFGGCSKVGYAPDQFGNISQLPAILCDFGIDSFVFARGFSEYEYSENGELIRRPCPLEFIWEGADSSRVNAFYMRGWYNNAQRIPADTAKAKKMADNIVGEFEGMAATEYLLLMNGVDHLEAQDDLLTVIENFNSEYGTEFEMKQYSLADYIDNVKCRIKERGIIPHIHKGELRRGGTGDILPGTLSSRHYIKVANVRAQNMIEQRLEPLYSMLELSGMEGIYSADHFRYAWKKLIQNHPHDTICGCSADAVHRHSLDNYQRLGEFCADMLSRGLTELAYHSNGVKAANGKGYVITAVNTTAVAQTGIVKLWADILCDDDIGEFYIEDMEGNKVDFGVFSKDKLRRDVTSPLNLPGSKLVNRYGIYLDAGEVKPYSHKSFKIIPRKGDNNSTVDTAEKVLENEYIKLSVSECGKIDITFKETEVTVKDAVYIEDTADRGSSYNYKPAGDKPLTTKELTPEIQVLENNAFCGRIKLTWNMPTAIEFDFDKGVRHSKTNNLCVSLILELTKHSRMLNIGYELNNTCRDHRMRLVVSSEGGKGAKCIADMPFDIVERTEEYFEPDPISHTFPNTSFVALEAGGKGVAVLTEGAHEAERICGDKLALTILRATGVIERGADNGPIGGEMWVAEENQCIRNIEGRIAVTAYTRASELPEKVCCFRTPVIGITLPADRRVFAGGRPAVQDCAYSGIYYLPDEWANTVISNNSPALEIKGEGIGVTALKLAEDGQGMVLRFCNYSDSQSVAEIAVNAKICLSDMAEKKREFIGFNNVRLTLTPKKIVTLYITKK